MYADTSWEGALQAMKQAFATKGASVNAPVSLS